jgi:hypothetical protein
VLDKFREVWCVDFEFGAPDGERQQPRCLVARELRCGKLIRQWVDEFGAEPPYPIGEDVLFVAFFASAELQCHIVQDWRMPANVLDLFVEFRARLNGHYRKGEGGWGLLAALEYFGEDTIGTTEKITMRDLAIRGGPYTEQEKIDLLDYCQTDVDALVRLLPKMLPLVDLPRALFRGRYMAAIAKIEWTGTPIDAELLQRVQDAWPYIKDHVIGAVNPTFGVYNDKGEFKTEKFAYWLARNRIPWPILPRGQLDLEDDTFRDMERVHPIVAPLRACRQILSGFRLNKLRVGSDGRNRCLLSPFSTVTSRNAPSTSKFIWGPSACYRTLMRAEPGYALVYADWSGQEFAIAAKLSNDLRMQEAYTTDPYLFLGKKFGSIPEHATKKSHAAERDVFKVVVLASGYGMQGESLAWRLGIPPIDARRMLQTHLEEFKTYWAWSHRVVQHGKLFGRVHTRLDWPLQVIGHGEKPTKDLTIRNFPIQGTGADIMRLAICLAVESGLEVTAPVHDAIMIHAPLDALDEHIATLKWCMTEASKQILDGFEIRVEAKAFPHPHPYIDGRGVEMWDKIMSLVEQAEEKRKAA